MALINCPECGLTISEHAIKCVHCGCPAEINNVDGIEYIVRRMIDDDLVYIKITATMDIGDWLVILNALEDRVDHYKQCIGNKQINKIEKLSLAEIEKLDAMDQIYWQEMQDAKRLKERLNKIL